MRSEPALPTSSPEQGAALAAGVAEPSTLAHRSLMLKPTIQAGLCFIALDIFRQHSLPVSTSREQVAYALGVSRSYAYEQAEQLRTLLGRDATPSESQSSANQEELVRLRTENEVLRYRLEHPGCLISAGRTVYSNEFRSFVLELAARVGVGERMTQEEFAQVCGIPLPTLKPWWQSMTASPTRAAPAAETASPSPSAPAISGTVLGGNVTETLPPVSAPKLSTEVLSAATSQESSIAGDSGHSATTTVPQATHSPTVGFTLEMLSIVQEWEQWQGSFDAFVHQHLPTLGIHHGKQMVANVLHLAAARKLLRRPPPKPSARGSTFRPPPGVQWSSDGKQVVVWVDGERFIVTWQPMLDIGSGATVGSVVRSAEDTAGVITSFSEGIETTGAAPAALLLDNKAPNKSAELHAVLPDNTFVMYGTKGRGQSKATIEGSFGLFAQELGPVIATIDSSTKENIAFSVAQAVTRAYAAGRNRRPRRNDGKTSYELYRHADSSPEEINAAIARLRDIKHRIDTRTEREAARRDPYVRAALAEAFARFGFTDEGDLLSSLAKLSREAIQSAIAIYAAKLEAKSLPADAGLRYFAGIARQRQHNIELRLYEAELVSLLEREDQLVTVYFQRKAAEFASLDLAPCFAAIVYELLTVPAPVAQVFWRRHFESLAAQVPLPLREQLRRWLCQRIRRFFRATKQLRLQLLDLVLRALPPAPLPVPNSS